MLKVNELIVSFILTVVISLCLISTSHAQALQRREDLIAKAERTFGEPKNATKLIKDGHLWVDAKKGLVIVDGYVTLRRGQLEMFACPTGTKEHESIVALFCASRYVHAALIAVGADVGRPTKFEPYEPASGTTIKINVLWKDEKGERKQALAQTWIRDFRRKKEMVYDWVFAGSGFFKDVDTGEERYLGDSGDLICVANFPTATLDLAIESAAANSALVFEAFEERIPPIYTIVRVVLRVTDQEPRRSDDESAEKNDAPTQVEGKEHLKANEKGDSGTDTKAKSNSASPKQKKAQRGDSDSDATVSDKTTTANDKDDHSSKERDSDTMSEDAVDEIFQDFEPSKSKK